MNRLKPAPARKVSFSEEPREQLKHLGPDHWEIIHTCADCGTKTTSTIKVSTWSSTILTSNTSLTGNPSWGPNSSSHSLIVTDPSEL